MLDAIQSMTLHENGIPLHALPGARHKDCSPPLSLQSSPAQSQIFVVEYAEFKAMSSFDIQRIFRHRHILVLNHPQERTYSFDLQCLHALGDLDQKRDMQGEPQPNYA